MMDIFQKDFLTIIRCALTGEKGAVSKDFDLTKAINLAREHNIVAIFYEGAILCGISSETPVMAEMFNDVCKTVVVDVRQAAMIKKLTNAFDNENIDYLPLKGILLKQIYPKSEMRAMGDADILIRLEQYSQIQEILNKLNFTFKCETDHEFIWTNSSLFLELHKSVMTTYNRDFYKHFDTGWSFAHKVNGANSRYEFKAEDFYIYIFVHFTKHYRISGIGIKHILDLWVYSRAFKKMDQQYIIDVLTRLKLLEFHKNVIDTLNAWFCGADFNDKVEIITNVIFSSGQYGSYEMTNVNRAIRESKNNDSGLIWKTKCKRVFFGVFPPYHNLRNSYPFLKRFSFLLPLVWVYRWLEIIMFRRKEACRYVHDLNAISQSSVDKNLRTLQYVGLDFEE